MWLEAMFYSINLSGSGSSFFCRFPFHQSVDPIGRDGHERKKATLSGCMIMKSWAPLIKVVIVDNYQNIFYPAVRLSHRVHIFTRDETGLVCLPTQLERTLQLPW